MNYFINTTPPPNILKFGKQATFKSWILEQTCLLYKLLSGDAVKLKTTIASLFIPILKTIRKYISLKFSVGKCVSIKNKIFFRSFFEKFSFINPNQSNTY